MGKILILKHVLKEGPGIIADFFANTKWQMLTVELEKGETLPSHLSDVKAVIILGGPMSVHSEDEFPFLKEEGVFLKSVIKNKIPVLGICLGAQLLAKICGAEVKKAPFEEIGWYNVSLTQEGIDDVVFEGVNEMLDVFQWHEDTFDVPRGGSLLAVSDRCKNQAFRYGRNVYGLQFHIEVTPLMVETWLEEYEDKDKAHNMIMETYNRKIDFMRQGHQILFNFSKLIL